MDRFYASKKKIILLDCSIWRLSQGYVCDDGSRLISIFDDVNDGLPFVAYDLMTHVCRLFICHLSSLIKENASALRSRKFSCSIHGHRNRGRSSTLDSVFEKERSIFRG